MNIFRISFQFSILFGFKEAHNSCTILPFYLMPKHTDHLFCLLIRFQLSALACSIKSSLPLAFYNTCKFFSGGSVK